MVSVIIPLASKQWGFFFLSIFWILSPNVMVCLERRGRGNPGWEEFKWSNSSHVVWKEREGSLNHIEGIFLKEKGRGAAICYISIILWVSMIMSSQNTMQEGYQFIRFRPFGIILLLLLRILLLQSGLRTKGAFAKILLTRAFKYLIYVYYTILCNIGRPGVT